MKVDGGHPPTTPTVQSAAVTPYLGCGESKVCKVYMDSSQNSDAYVLEWVKVVGVTP